MGQAQRNLRLLIAYDGTDFFGWQRQPNRPTIQGLLEQSLKVILDEEVVLHGSGRTDAGAHAAGQVANFLTSCRIPCSNLQKALNDALPFSVRIRRVDEVAADFHARYSARCKTYRYRISQQAVCSPFVARYAHHYPYPLDVGRMDRAARLLEGTHDFTSFAAAGDMDEDEPAKRGSAIRQIFQSRVTVKERLQLVVYSVQGSGFLRHMVRNIVGTLIEVGRGNLAPEEMARILSARERSLAGPTAPARGLCLMKVEYD